MSSNFAFPLYQGQSCLPEKPHDTFSLSCLQIEAHHVEELALTYIALPDLIEARGSGCDGAFIVDGWLL